VNNSNLSIKNLNKSFVVDREKLHVLRDIDMQIKAGEFVSVVGHSGCGKSTLLKIIAGLVSYECGSVESNHNKIFKPDTDRGMVFQDHRLLPWMTVKENVALGLHHLSKLDKDKIIREHLKLVKLERFENSYPHQLSGGMAQRAAIARALINKPEILLLDEPFGALDALTRIQMQKEILRIWEQEKTTMVLVTHDIDEAIYLSDRIFVMSSRPGTIQTIIPVNIGRPRDRGSSNFAHIKKKVLSYFFQEDTTSVEYYI
jgi:sulfonate transport system ATP-binding protein